MAGVTTTRAPFSRRSKAAATIKQFLQVLPEQDSYKLHLTSHVDIDHGIIVALNPHCQYCQPYLLLSSEES